VIVFRDVSAARAMALEMTHSAQHDFLTGMPNRMLLNDRVNQALAWAQRNSKKVAVLFLDLDGFKHINDSLGHPTGDKLLQSIAKRLVDCVRGSDTVSRQGPATSSWCCSPKWGYPKTRPSPPEVTRPFRKHFTGLRIRPYCDCCEFVRERK
jgi:hypothetical protein